MQTYSSDLLVIGAGLSGERVAVEAAGAGFSVTCLSIVPARRSHSSAAQGGMQAALGNCAMGEGDGPNVHFADTVKGSDWGADQEVARLFVEAAPVEMRRLASWGVPWNRVVPGKDYYFKAGERFEKEEKAENEGLITSRNFGGTAKWRTCYTSDGTGHAVMCTMDNRCAQLGIEVLDRKDAVALVHDGATCTGAVVRCLRTGELELFRARAVVVATGGFGRIYRSTTSAVICDGAGHILALDTGLVPIGNPEAVQFHPTGIVPTDILVTEGCRGDGGTLLDVHHERFMQVYEPEKAELASRDVVARRMTEHMRAGHGVKSPYGEHLWLDIRHLGDKHISTKLREVDEIYFIPEGTPLNVQLAKFQRNKERIGLIVDEYGDIQGLITLDDILEEIVGDFTTTITPAPSEEIHPQPDGSFLVEGSSSIRELNKEMNWQLPIDGPRTLNGAILEYLEEIPQPNISLRLAGYPIEIMEVENNMVKMARIMPDLYRNVSGFED